MKHLKLFFALFAMLALGAGNAWGAEASFTIKFKDNGSDASTALTTATFTKQVAEGTDLIKSVSTSYCYAGTGGLKCSSNKNNGTFTLTLNNSYTISKIVLSVKNKNATTKTVKVGNTSFSTSDSWNTTSFEDLAFTGTETTSDQITVSLAGTANSKRVAYIASMTVYYKTDEPGTEEPVYSVKLTQPANGTISAEGLNAEGKAAKGTEVTLKAEPSEDYKFGTWTVTGASGNVTVTENKFTMPAEDVTVTVSFVKKTKYTIKWNVAEGSVADTKVYEGDALGTLPKADVCSEGKVFIGWTEATSVNPDGSGINYAKETDIPTGNKEYNAVYAKAGATATVTDELTLSWTDVTGSSYLDWSKKGSNTSAVYAGNSAGGNSSIQLRKSDSDKPASGIITTNTGGKVKKIVVTWNANTTNGRTLNVYGKNTAYTSVAELYAEATAGTLIGTIVKETSTTLEITDEYEYIGLRSASGAMYLDEVEITWEATSYSDYSLNCDINEEPALIPSTEELDFGAKYVGVEYTETFTINASNLKGDITLAVTGNYFDVTPKTIASNASFPQTVTVTYKPEEASNHTATLKITSTEAEDKIISLKGSATEAKIYTKTDLANITKYDEVLIVGTNAEGSFAMANNEATSSGPKAISVIVDDNTIATDNTNIQWSVGNTDGKLIFAPKDAETWLYCNNSNNGLRIGSDVESMTFEIKDDYIFNTVQSRYIGIYNSQEWRSYTLTNGGEFPTNIKDQTFAFYIIKGEVPDNVFSITYNTNGGNAISPATDLTTIPSTLPTPTKEGYNFAGWYTDNAFTAPAIAGTLLTDNITLYAKWADPYTVAYARTLIAADLENTGVYAYVAGMVTAVEEISTEYGNATYSIGDTEDAAEILKVYRGNYLANEKFTAADQLKKGDQVVVYGKMINHTTGGYQFAQENYIYKLTSAAGKETTTLSWSATTCKVQIGATNTFPTLTKSHDITIKYTSSNTSVATIANDGSITLVAAGTTTITAAIEEDATYAASSASYELTVVEVVPTGIFQLYSGELVEGEYVLVDGAKDKALKAAVAGTTRLAGEDVTIADNAILNPDASIVWNVAKNGTDWTIYNEYEGKYVAGTGVKNAAQLLTDGTDEKALWTISGTETYDIVNKVNEEGGVNSHLRWGDTYWACYGSTTGKALRLYKKIDVPTPTISLASGTYIGTQTATVSCALATATIYYTINGDTPTTSSASIAAGGTVSITESCTLKVIAVANTKESSVVETTYKIIPDGGIWVLVDDATSLQAGDLVVIASKENNAIAGKIEEGKDYMTSVNDAEFSTNKVFITKLPENAMTLTLGGSAGAWTLEYQQLYLNASGANNSLGADATTTWNITIDESANATIAYDVYAIRYNKSNPRFKSYNSTNGIVLPQIYKYTTDFYTRDVTNGNYGTICLPYASASTAGAYFYEVAGKEEGKVYLASVDALEAGVPYIFEATAGTITVTYQGEAVAEAGTANGLVGTFTNETIVPEGAYILYQNAFRTSDNPANPNKVNAYRAYLVMEDVPSEFTKMPGRRYIGMDVEGENEATGFENITAPAGKTVKAIVNGQLIIIRDGEMYNAQGQKL